MRSRFKDLEPDRQERLIEAAITEFCDLGFAASSLNRILKKAGMSKSSYYYYFNDKADILEEIGQRSAVLLIANIGKISSESLTYASFWSEIEDMLLRAKDVLKQDLWYVRVCRLCYHYRSNGDPAGANSRLYDAMHDWIDGLVCKGRALGAIRPDLPVSLLISIAMGLAEAIDRGTSQVWDDLASDECSSQLWHEAGLFRRLLE